MQRTVRDFKAHVAAGLPMIEDHGGWPHH